MIISARSGRAVGAVRKWLNTQSERSRVPRSCAQLSAAGVIAAYGFTVLTLGGSLASTLMRLRDEKRARAVAEAAAQLEGDVVAAPGEVVS